MVTVTKFDYAYARFSEPKSRNTQEDIDAGVSGLNIENEMTVNYLNSRIGSFPTATCTLCTLSDLCSVNTYYYSTNISLFILGDLDIIEVTPDAENAPASVVTRGIQNISVGNITKLNCSYQNLDGYYFDNEYNLKLDQGHFAALTDFRASNSYFDSGFLEDIMDLTSLNTLILDNVFNQSDILDGVFSPTIPTRINRLTDLSRLELYNNLLRGEIPAQMTSLKALTSLVLTTNLFNSPLIPDLATLTGLKGLIITNSQLTGTLPSSLFSLPLLLRVVLTGNHLTGTIPAVAMNPQFQQLNLAQNRFSGNLGAFSGRLSDIYDPSFPPSLQRMNFSFNLLTGTIPNNLPNLPSLALLDLSDNNFNKMIPSSLGSLASLLQLKLNNNQLTGTVPTALTNLVIRTNGDAPLSILSLFGTNQLNVSSFPTALFQVAMNDYSFLQTPIPTKSPSSTPIQRVYEPTAIPTELYAPVGDNSSTVDPSTLEHSGVFYAILVFAAVAGISILGMLLLWSRGHKWTRPRKASIDQHPISSPDVPGNGLNRISRHPSAFGFGSKNANEVKLKEEMSSEEGRSLKLNGYKSSTMSNTMVTTSATANTTHQAQRRTSWLLKMTRNRRLPARTHTSYLQSNSGSSSLEIRSNNGSPNTHQLLVNKKAVLLPASANTTDGLSQLALPGLPIPHYSATQAAGSGYPKQGSTYVTKSAIHSLHIQNSHSRAQVINTESNSNSGSSSGLNLRLQHFPNSESAESLIFSQQTHTSSGSKPESPNSHHSHDKDSPPTYRQTFHQNSTNINQIPIFSTSHQNQNADQPIVTVKKVKPDPGTSKLGRYMSNDLAEVTAAAAKKQFFK